MQEKSYAPPFSLTDMIIHTVADIGELIGIASMDDEHVSNPLLRRENRIRTIHASLAIENITLTLDQMTEIIDGKRIIGDKNEIRAVKNAFNAYNLITNLNPYSTEDLLMAHGVLMHGLVEECGQFRSGGVGVFKGDALIHMAPQAQWVPTLVGDLLDWTKKAYTHPLIKSCVFHYELEFIHPLSDGNGRIGRLWQTLLLYQWKHIFAWLPMETLIAKQQGTYYDVLAASDKAADSTAFIEFMLAIIRDALSAFVQPTVQVADQVDDQATVQVKRLLRALGNETLPSKDIMLRLGLKHRPTFNNNYLRPALERGLIEMTVPDKPTSSRQRYRATVIRQ